MALEWVPFIVGAAVLTSVSFILDRLILRNGANPVAYFVLMRIGATAVMVAFVFLFTPFAWPSDPLVWVLGAFAAACWVAATLVDYRATGAGDLTLSAPLRRLRIPIVMLFSSAFFAEPITPAKLAAFGLIVAGVLVASKSHTTRLRDLKNHPVLRLVALVALLSGIALTLDKAALGLVANPFSYVIVSYSFELLYIIPLALKTHGVRALFDAKPTLVAVSAFATAALAVFWYLSFSLAPAAQALLVFELNLPLVFLGSYFILQERTNFKRRALGGAIVLAGAALAALA